MISPWADRRTAILRSRTLLSMASLLLVMAMVASGCSGSDDDEGGAAASQPAGADQLFKSGFQLASANFQNEVRPYVRVPKKNSCHAENLSPPLEWKEAPEGTRSFAILAEDLDHSTGRWVHWVVYNIPSDVTSLPEAVASSTPVLPDGTTQGTNDDRQPGYHGICPAPNIRAYWSVSKEGPHRFELTIYALDIELGLPPGATKAELNVAIEDHVLAEAKTLGKFQPPNINLEQLQVFATRTAEAEKATATASE